MIHEGPDCYVGLTDVAIRSPSSNQTKSRQGFAPKFLIPHSSFLTPPSSVFPSLYCAGLTPNRFLKLLLKWKGSG